MVTTVLGGQDYYFHLRDEETEITVKARIFSKVTQSGGGVEIRVLAEPILNHYMDYYKWEMVQVHDF